MASTYYSILNIPVSATQRDIKVAYRKLVQKHHPDVNTSGNDELIKTINVAYETLSNPEKKAVYDQRLLGNYNTSTTTSYNPPARPRRRTSSFRYRYRGSASNTSYTYSTKTKLQGWGAVILAILLIFIGIRAMHYYSSGYYYRQASIAEANENYNEAFRLYQLAIRDWGSKSVEASIKIVELNQQIRSYNAMIDHSQTGLKYEPDSAQSARLYYLQGIGYEHVNQYKDAKKSYLNSLSYKFNKDTIYNHLGIIYLNKLENYNEAQKIYTYLLIDEANNESDYYNRGLCYQLLGKHAEAIEDFLIILKNDPYNGRILFQLGRSYLALGQTGIACEYLRFAQRQGVNISPSDFEKACE
ncbi:MAG: DnaJ domain-containing protein [Cyclobacteriaceae bacterium]|nr:DnaJ domain-containing protein [Cyclobacteriaceae bacterium]